MQYSVLFLTATAASWILVRAVGRWARRRSMLDVPNSRSLHWRPTPTGGGLGIIAVCGIGLAGWCLASPAASATGGRTSLAAYALATALVALVSWIDDLRLLASSLRLVVQAAAAIVLVVGCSWWQEVVLPGCGAVELGRLGLLVTFLWIVGLTNAYNFMDGIDGIAGAQAVVAGLGWFVLGHLTAQPMVGMLGLLVAGASFGFLMENWSPARIFMGDVGSASLGFTFAALPVMAAQDEPRLALAGVLVVWPFVFDTSLTLLRRLLLRQNVFQAHRTHLFQRLVVAGWPPAVVATVYAGFSLVGFVLAIGFVRDRAASGWPIPVVIGSLAAGWWWLVRWQESRRTRRNASTTTPGLREKGTGSVAQTIVAQGEPLPPRCLSPSPAAARPLIAKGDRHRRRKRLLRGPLGRGDGASPLLRPPM